MGWADLTLLAGVFICLAGLVLMLRQAGRGVWWAREQPRQTSARHVEGIGVFVNQTVFFGGMALTMFGNIARHISDRTLPAKLWLSLLSGAAVLLAFGVQLGRLLIRWQVQRLLAELDAESVEITPRSASALSGAAPRE